MKLLFKITLILIWVVILGYVGWMILIFSAFGGFDKDYSVSDLKEHFMEHQTEINGVKTYINQITPWGKRVDIEFSDDYTLEIFQISTKDEYIIERDLYIRSHKANDLLKQLGWTDDMLKTLKEKLDKAGCISVESGEPTTIGFQRSGLGKYYYKIFDKPISDSLKVEYNTCNYIIVNNKLVLEYGGGATGPQCFYNVD